MIQPLFARLGGPLSPELWDSVFDVDVCNLSMMPCCMITHTSSAMPVEVIQYGPAAACVVHLH
jgi:hypothetical protein